MNGGVMLTQTRRTLDPVREHLEAVRTSSELTRWFRREREPSMEQVTPKGVIAALNRAKIIPVLMGMHGLAGYRSEARATQDVDVLVTKKDVRKAVRVLEEEFPYLEVYDGPAVVRLVNPASGKAMIDVMKPTSEVMRLVFRHTIRIGKTHRIPELEMGVVCKFVAMTSPIRRDTKRMQDLLDFIDIVENKRKVIDLDELKSLAELAQRGGGNKVIRMVAEIDAGRRTSLLVEAGIRDDGP
jgi:hypothetical protein